MAVLSRRYISQKITEDQQIIAENSKDYLVLIYHDPTERRQRNRIQDHCPQGNIHKGLKCPNTGYHQREHEQTILVEGEREQHKG